MGGPGAAGGFGVHHGCGEPGYVVDEPVFHVVSDAMGGLDGERGVDSDSELGAQAVAYPPNSYLVGAVDTVDRGGGALDGFDGIGVDRVKEAAQHLRGGVA